MTGEDNDVRGALRLLVVENDPDLATLIGLILQDLGHVVLCASGEDALRHLENDDHFDAVVLDLKLGGISGADVIDQMTASGMGTPVVVVSGVDGGDPLLARATRAGAVFLKKPFDNQALLRTVKSVVGATSP